VRFSRSRLRRATAAGMALLGLGVTAVVTPPVAAGPSGAGGAGHVHRAADVEPVDLPDNRPGTGQIYNGLEEVASGQCVGVYEIAGEAGCTHRPDAPPPGYTMAGEVPPVEGGTLAAAAACTGDGTSGPRVQVLYVHAPGNDRSPGTSPPSSSGPPPSTRSTTRAPRRPAGGATSASSTGPTAPPPR
jgi:hypothetical protein